PHHGLLLVEGDGVQACGLDGQADEAHVDLAADEHVALSRFRDLGDLERHPAEPLRPDPAPLRERDPRHETDAQSCAAGLGGAHPRSLTQTPPLNPDQGCVAAYTRASMARRSCGDAAAGTQTFAPR